MSWLFNKPQQPVQQPKLPVNFAEKVLNLELDVESNAATKEEIQELLELYSQAVEHYSSIKSERYTVFTNKIQALLMKPYVNKMFGAENKQESKQIHQQHVQKKEQIKNNIQFIQQMDSNKQVQQMMTAAIDEKIKRENIIADDFKMQDHRVQQRMLQRIKDPSKYNMAISKSTSLRHLKLDIESQSQQSTLPDTLEQGQDIRSDPILDKYLEAAAQQQFTDLIKNDYDQVEQIPQQPTQNQENQISIPESEFVNLPIKPSQIKDKLYSYFNDDPQPIDQQNWSLQLGDLSHPKSKKVREMVNKNTELIKQKKELNNILPC